VVGFSASAAARTPIQEGEVVFLAGGGSPIRHLRDDESTPTGAPAEEAATKTPIERSMEEASLDEDASTVRSPGEEPDSEEYTVEAVVAEYPPVIQAEDPIIETTTLPWRGAAVGVGAMVLMAAVAFTRPDLLAQLRGFLNKLKSQALQLRLRPARSVPPMTPR